MKAVALTQRVEIVHSYKERRDSLDQRWAEFLARCGLAPIAVPNNAAIVPLLLSAARVDGIVLTGGGDLVAYGGRTPERDATETLLLHLAVERHIPLIGVCRGMQAIQHFVGVPLRRVAGHVTPTQEIVIDGVRQTVNSFHDFGTTESSTALETWAHAHDGIVKAVRHRELPMIGIMWHPERVSPFRDADIALFRHTFGVD